MRRDQQLSKKYQKNQRFEKVITSLNNQLFESQQELLENIEEKYPTLHILGAPRSGTTLASQLIPSYLPVGHINNLIATFWKAPIYGIELSKKLIGSEYASNFQSDFGRTSGINEPHEFGYFWNYHLAYESLEQKPQKHEKSIDWQQLSALLKNMAYSYEKPIVFKSFLAGFHAHRLHCELPRTCFIYIKRDLTDNVLSILKLREKLNGDINTWGSIKPKQYEQLKNIGVYEQVVGQILCLEHEYLTQLEKIPSQNKLIWKYEDLCNRPVDFLKAVSHQFLGERTGDIIEALPFSIKKSNATKEERRKIAHAVDTIINLYPNLKRVK